MCVEQQKETSRWLRYAHEDLLQALHIQQEEGFPRFICFFSQQAAEKALKSAYAWLNITIPRSHDLDYLLTNLPGTWSARNISKSDLAQLSEWAVESRYPGDMPESTDDDATQALLIAQTLFASINDDLVKAGFTAGK